MEILKLLIILFLSLSIMKSTSEPETDISKSSSSSLSSTTNTNTSNNKTLSISEDKNLILPEILIVQPVRRKGSSKSILNTHPCGGLDKSLANTLSPIGEKLNTIWEIRTPIPNGNCTVSISAGLDEDFKALKPVDVVDYNTDFSFACGRQAGFDFKEFVLPEDYACDHCTLQLKWETLVGTVYSCSDLMIIGNKIENCLSKCLNGGACVNGECKCKKGFKGSFCEIDLMKGSNLGWILLIILILLSIGVGAYMLFRKNQNSWTKTGTKNEYRKDFIENKKEEMEIN